MTDFIEQTLREAGKVLLGYFGSVKVLGEKAHERDIFTEADVASQKLILAAIAKNYPDHGIVAEEEGGTRDTDRDWVWYVDPLDGTKNFASGTMLFGTIMGLSHKGVMKAGGIYLPVSDELYTAEDGKGAYLNGKRIACSTQENFATSYGTGSMGIGGTAYKIGTALSEHGGTNGWNNALGSAAVSQGWVASGKRDWYYSRGAYDWDYAGPSLILKEAGCTVTSFEGTPWKPGDRSVVAANPTLHAFMMTAFKGLNLPPKK